MEKLKIDIIKVINPENFYVKLLSFEETMFRLYMDMFKFYTKSVQLKEKLATNDLCVVLSSEHKYYLRAKLLEKTNTDTWKVFLLDKAEEEIIQSNQIYNIIDEFMPLNSCPFAAVACRMYGIKPSSEKAWNETSCDIFKSLLKNYSYFLLEKKGKADLKLPLAIKLYAGNRTLGTALESDKHEVVLINEELIKLGIAKGISGIPLYSPNKVKEVCKESSKKETEKILNDYLKSEPIREKQFSMIPMSVDDTGKIYFHNFDKFYIIDKMEDYIHETIENDYCNPDPNYKWRLGQLCVIRYHFDKQWYRGKVVDLNPLQAMMVDYGNIENVSPEEIRPDIMLPNVPVFSHTCRLHRVFPKKDKFLTKDMDFLHSVIVDKLCDANVKGTGSDGELIVELKLNDIDINKQMLEHSQYIKSFPNISKRNENINAINKKQNKNQPVEYKYTNEHITAQKITIKIVNILAYNQLIVSVTGVPKMTESFSKILQEINNCSQYQPRLQSFSLGTPCIAQYKEDKKWYRAQIVSVRNLDQNLVRIWFVDYGNTELVKTDDLRCVKEDWLKVPMQIYKCIIKAESDKSEECLKILHNLCECDVYATVELQIPKLTLNLYTDKNCTESIFKSLF